VIKSLQPKRKLSLDAQLSKTLDTADHHLFSLRPIMPESLESQGFILGVIRVSFPKTFKTKNRKVNDYSVRYLILSNTFDLEPVSARAILKLALKYTLL